MTTEMIVYARAAGLTGKAELTWPLEAPPRATAVLLHCFTCGADGGPAADLMQALLQAGMAVLRLDVAALGVEPGGEASFPVATAEVLAAVAALATRGLAADLLVGHGVGGALALAVAPALPAVRGLVTLGAPASDASLARLAPALRDVAGYAPLEGLHGLRKGLLLLHAPGDPRVGLADAGALYEAALHPKSFVSLDHADPMLTDPADARYVGTLIAAWASHYVSRLAQPAGEAVDGAVTRTGRTPYATAVRAGRHAWWADEPAAVGGGDRGPGPYDLLTAALGACTGMTLRMYADRKGWPIETIEVQVQHDRVPAPDGAPAAHGGKVDRFRRRVAVTGPLTEAQRARLGEIADRCPVHRTLSQASVIETAVEGG
ncbi:MAG: OsmC family protein [Candidatus Sericytochromatia bacterium]|nr:OsmC family protein [Candidatus Sericytochromatia bacterium]